MKPVKIISSLFVFIFLLNVSASKISGQSTENMKPIEKADSTTETKSSQSKIEKSEVSEVQKNPGETNGSKPIKDTNNERYRIGYQDTVEVNVFRHP